MIEIQELLKRGVIGFYNSCEAIQIFLIDKREDKKYINLYTIFTLEEKDYAHKTKEYLTDKLKTVDNNFSLGIEKHYFSIEDCLNIFNKLKNHEEKKGIILNGNSFKLLESQYISHDELNRLNHILKNNFSTGSYIYEFFEEDKSVFKYFENKPEKFKKIIDAVYNEIPIDFSLNSDRLGNYVFQLPITIVKIKSKANKNFDGFYIDFMWNKKLNVIPNCFITSSIKMNKNFLSNVIVEYDKKNKQLIKTGPLDKIGEFSIWRLNPNLLLYNDVTSFYKRTYIEMVTDVGERKFKNYFGEQSVELRTSNDYAKDYEKYIQIIEENNFYNFERELEKKCSFKLYGGDKKESEDSQDCLIKLIKAYGVNGIDLLDPYLTYEEILSTLYYSNVANVPLRAITSKNVLKNYNNDENIKGIDDFIELNKEKFKELSNNHNLNLEFRIERGKNSFHDRFLIFHGNPKKLEKPKVYSLGASINGFGKNYHILQEISTPNKIITLFNNLWEKLDDENGRNEIWNSKKL